MKNKIQKTIVLSLLLTAATIPLANASSIPNPFDDSERAGRGEVYGIVEYLNGWNTTKFYDGNISLKIDSGMGGGAGFGINFNDYLNLNTTLTGANLDFEAENFFFGNNASGDTSVVQWNVGLDYNILKSRLTPLLTTGVGVTYFSGNFDNSWLSDFGEANLSWGIGGGVRWDISDNWFMKAIYRMNWTNLENSDNTTRFNSIALGVGYVF